MTNQLPTKMVPCPFCGQDIPSRSSVCPYCGSDDKTGWSQNRFLGGLDPEDDFDYDAALEREFGTKSAKKPKISWISVVGGILLVLGLLALLRGLL
jgi:hypothetical protein